MYKQCKAAQTIDNLRAITRGSKPLVIVRCRPLVNDALRHTAHAFKKFEVVSSLSLRHGDPEFHNIYAYLRETFQFSIALHLCAGNEDSRAFFDIIQEYLDADDFLGFEFDKPGMHLQHRIQDRCVLSGSIPPAEWVPYTFVPANSQYPLAFRSRKMYYPPLLLNDFWPAQGPNPNSLTIINADCSFTQSDHSVSSEERFGHLRPQVTL